MSAKEWIARLQLEKHPEGGWFVETFRDAHLINHGSHNASTAIYFLLEAGEPSHLHRIDSAEMWHFYAGDPLLVHQLDPTGHHIHRLGRDWERGERFQAVVPPGAWFGAETLGEYSLVGCTVAPGFTFSGFELGTRKQLENLFPDHRDIVHKLTS